MSRFLPQRKVTYVMPKPQSPVRWSEAWPKLTEILRLLTGRKP